MSSSSLPLRTVGRDPDWLDNTYSDVFDSFIDTDYFHAENAGSASCSGSPDAIVPSIEEWPATPFTQHLPEQSTTSFESWTTSKTDNSDADSCSWQRVDTTFSDYKASPSSLQPISFVDLSPIQPQSLHFQHMLDVEATESRGVHLVNISDVPGFSSVASPAHASISRQRYLPNVLTHDHVKPGMFHRQHSDRNPHRRSCSAKLKPSSPCQAGHQALSAEGSGSHVSPMEVDKRTGPNQDQGSSSEFAIVGEEGFSTARRPNIHVMSNTDSSFTSESSMQDFKVTTTPFATSTTDPNLDMNIFDSPVDLDSPYANTTAHKSLASWNANKSLPIDFASSTASFAKRGWSLPVFDNESGLPSQDTICGDLRASELMISGLSSTESMLTSSSPSQSRQSSFHGKTSTPSSFRHNSPAILQHRAASFHSSMQSRMSASPAPCPRSRTRGQSMRLVSHKHSMSAGRTSTPSALGLGLRRRAISLAPGARSVDVGFVNFTPEDSGKILTGVAPSGSSKTKARREREAAEKRRKLSKAAARAIIEAGGDLAMLEREGLLSEN